MKKIIALICILPIFLSGCWDQKIFETRGFTLMIGVEQAKKEGEYLITATQPAIGAKKKYGIETLTTTAQGLRKARENRNRMASRRTEAGKIQQILFSEDVAKKGINEWLEIFNRDPENPALSWVIVVEGSPLDMINKSSKFTDIPGPALYINQLMNNNIKDATAPEARISNFNIAYFAPGIDPVAALVKLGEKDIIVMGSAVFSDDKMAGKLNCKQTGLLIGMMGRGKQKEYSYIASYPPGMSQQNKKNFAISLTESKRTLNIKMKGGKPSVNINMKYVGAMQEYGWDDLTGKPVQESIEKHLDALLKKDCMEIVKYLKQTGSDPIGIGEIVKAKYYSYWSSINWKDVYKDIDINVNVNVKIKQIGAID